MNFKKYMINIENEIIVLNILKRNIYGRKILYVNLLELLGNILKKNMIKENVVSELDIDVFIYFKN